MITLKRYLVILSGILIGIQSNALNLDPGSRISNIASDFNPESSRVVNRVSNMNPESKVTNVINNHPGAVTAACAVYAKGVCIAVKAAKKGSSVIMAGNKTESTSVGSYHKDKAQIESK